MTKSATQKQINREVAKAEKVPVANPAPATMEEKVALRLQVAESDLQDAIKDMDKAARQMERRAKEATENTQRMLDGIEYSTMWVDFAECDYKAAVEAHAKFKQLVEQVRMLKYLAKS